jgi:hypothetical protein
VSSVLHECNTNFSIWPQSSVSKLALTGLEGALEAFLCLVNNLIWHEALDGKADGQDCGGGSESSSA